MSTGTVTVRVELFGIPQLLTGRRQVEVPGRTLREVAGALAQQFPALAGSVVDPATGWLNGGYLFVVDGRFTRDPSCRVGPESSVLLVSAQAGGAS
jgi:molybdopterin converting factor small subunit